MRRMLFGAAMLAASLQLGRAQAPGATDPTPQTLDEFRAAAQRVLDDTGVPGAGLALVRAGGIEWAGGVGLADRDRRVPVTGDTHFRAGSISKTFVALALVQLYEDDKIDLDAPVASILPDLRVDNPWLAESPVRVRHLLEHTAGFDDMHFNEVYVYDGAPDLPLAEVLLRNPASRRVRWRPGTRMSYSNPGYGVAGLVIERVTGRPFDDYIRDKTFTPLGMTTSTFRTAPDEDAALAEGYGARTGPPVPKRRIYLRPAGALQTSAAELGRFVQMLLGWGEVDGKYVVDPEYLSNMEWPRTTLASQVGVRAGYGMGIASRLTLPYHVLGHDGGIDGFLSSYGYSPSRDVGYVVLVNSTHAPAAVTRIASLALRYLKREVEPTHPETVTVSADSLRPFEGYYLGASPRSQIFAPVERLLGGGSTVRLIGDRLELRPGRGPSVALVPMGDALFRRPEDLAASLAFTTAQDGTTVMVGPGTYAERTSRWPTELMRAAAALALGVAVLAPLAAGLRRWRRARTAATWAGLGPLWTALALVLALGAWAAGRGDLDALAVPSAVSMTLFAATTLYPLLVLAVCLSTAVLVVGRLRAGAAAFAVLVAVAHAGLAAGLWSWGMIGFRSWTY